MVHVFSMSLIGDTPDLTPDDIAAEARRLWRKALVGYDSLCLRGCVLEFSWHGLRAAERNLRFYGSSGAVALANEIASLLRLAVAWTPESRSVPADARVVQVI